jgi:rod shape-determining protein MreC
VDYVPTGQKVEVGETFYTSGEDRVFPKGLPVGKVTGVHEGGNFQDITIQPTGAEAAPEEVLVILDPVHQAIPEEASAETPVFLAPDVNSDSAPQPNATLTEADKLRAQYQKIGDAQKHVFGEGAPGTLPPNFNLKVPGVNAPAAPVGATGTSGPVKTNMAPTGSKGVAGAPVIKTAPPGSTGASVPIKANTNPPATNAPGAPTGFRGATEAPIARPTPLGSTGTSGPVKPRIVPAAPTGSRGATGAPVVRTAPSVTPPPEEPRP